jgi:hypothetical protein
MTIGRTWIGSVTIIKRMVGGFTMNILVGYFLPEMVHTTLGCGSQKEVGYGRARNYSLICGRIEIRHGYGMTEGKICSTISIVKCTRNNELKEQSRTIYICALDSAHTNCYIHQF